MKTKTYLPFLILLLIFAVNMQSVAQCAMCKTSVESDLENGGGSIATGLNSGILYLMAVPYLLIMTAGYFIFRKQVDAKLKLWRDRFFPSKRKAAN